MRKLKVLTESEEKICFKVHYDLSVPCEKTSCDNWIKNEEDQNCMVIGCGKGTHTLDSIGQVYGLSRMRICQILKDVQKKLKKNDSRLLDKS